MLRRLALAALLPMTLLVGCPEPPRPAPLNHLTELDFASCPIQGDGYTWYRAARRPVEYIIYVKVKNVEKDCGIRRLACSLVINSTGYIYNEEYSSIEGGKAPPREIDQHERCHLAGWDHVQIYPTN